MWAIVSSFPVIFDLNYAESVHAAAQRVTPGGRLTSCSVWIYMFDCFGTRTSCKTTDVLSFQIPLCSLCFALPRSVRPFLYAFLFTQLSFKWSSQIFLLGILLLETMLRGLSSSFSEVRLKGLLLILSHGGSSAGASSGAVSSGVWVQSRHGSGSRQGWPGGEQVRGFVKRSHYFPLYMETGLFVTDYN